MALNVKPAIADDVVDPNELNPTSEDNGVDPKENPVPADVVADPNDNPAPADDIDANENPAPADDKVDANENLARAGDEVDPKDNGIAEGFSSIWLVLGELNGNPPSNDRVSFKKTFLFSSVGSLVCPPCR